MAADPTLTPGPSTWNPTTGIGAYPTLGATPAQATISDATTGSTTATLADAATRELDNNELVSTNVAGLIAADSPLMQQAAAKANQQSNARGLLNSSIAVGAAQGAVMDRATPIATSDAATRSNVLNSNQTNTQNTNTFNATAVNDINKFNTNSDNETIRLNTKEQNNANLVNASEQNKILVQLMDNQNKMYLADIEASYKNIMQAQPSAMTLYQTSVKNISEILMDPDLTPEAKTAAVKNQNDLLSSGMKILGKISGLDFGDLLDFPEAPAAPAAAA